MDGWTGGEEKGTSCRVDASNLALLQTYRVLRDHLSNLSGSREYRLDGGVAVHSLAGSKPLLAPLLSLSFSLLTNE